MTLEPWMMKAPEGRWLDLERWERRDTFEFFKQYEQPLTNVCATVDVGQTLDYCKANGVSFFLASWFCALKAAHAVENLRMRLRDGQVFVHERLYVSTTVLLEDDSFGFAHMPWVDSFAEFVELGRQAVDIAKTKSLSLDALEGRDDAIYGTTLPWVRLTGITHAHRIPALSSVPKIVFGKYGDENGRTTMPVALEVHHALCDGLHIGRFFRAFEAALREPEHILAT